MAQRRCRCRPNADLRPPQPGAPRRRIPRRRRAPQSLVTRPAGIAAAQAANAGGRAARRNRRCSPRPASTAPIPISARRSISETGQLADAEPHPHRRPDLLAQAGPAGHRGRSRQGTAAPPRERQALGQPVTDRRRRRPSSGASAACSKASSEKFEATAALGSGRSLSVRRFSGAAWGPSHTLEVVCVSTCPHSVRHCAR